MLVESPSASLEEVVVWQGLSSIDDKRSYHMNKILDESMILL